MPITAITPEEWDLEIRKHSFNLKYDSQLFFIEEMLEAKIPRINRILMGILFFPDAKKKEICQNYIEGGEITDYFALETPVPISSKDTVKIDAEYTHEVEFFTKKVSWLKDKLTCCQKEMELRADELVARKPIGTTYYVDFTNGTDAYTGTKLSGTIDSTADTTHFVDDALTGADDYINGSYFWNSTRSLGSLITDFVALTDTVTLADAIAGMTAGDTYYILDSWKTVAKAFATLTAGDIAIVRRGMTDVYGADLNPTNDGNPVSPITIEADYADSWSDFANSAQTYTLAFGTKAIIASGNPDFVVGEWMYESTEDAKDWAYEVAGVQNSDSGTDDGADSDKLIDTGKFANTVIGTQVVNTTDSITGYVSTLVDNDTVEVTLDGRPSGSGGTLVVFDNGDTWTIADQIVLFLPYKGNIAAAGKTLVRMPDNPISDSNGGNFNWYFSNDTFWKLQGIEIISDDTSYAFYGSSLNGILFKDCVIYSATDDLNDSGFADSDGGDVILMKKCRVTAGKSLSARGSVQCSDSLLTAIAYCVYDSGNYIFNETEMVSSADILYCAPPSKSKFRNCPFTAVDKIVEYQDQTEFGTLYFEDYDGTIGDNRQARAYATADDTFHIASETTKVRPGGGASSIKVTPDRNMSTAWEPSRTLIHHGKGIALKDVEITLTAYLSSDDDTDWDANPLATELYMRAYPYGSATNNHRKMVQSTGVCSNFNIDDESWENTLTCTFTPLQTGVFYFEIWYCKTKEATNSNIFYCDSKVPKT